MKVFIPKKHGVLTLDFEDYLNLIKDGWKFSPAKQLGGYISPRAFKWDNKTKKTNFSLISRLILKPKNNQVVDHINRDTLNNSKSNLRLANKITNGQNMVSKTGACKYKGVSLSRKKKPHHRQTYRATIVHNKKQIYIGRFKTEVEAAKAYDKKAIELFGEFANTNFK